jgi:hypothetical protein
MVVSGSRSRSAAGPVEVAGGPGVDAGLRRDLVGGLGPLGIVGHHAGDGAAGERDQLGQAPAAGTQLGQVDGAPGAGAEVHADELLTAGGLAGDKQPRRHPAPPQGSAGACAAGAGPERRSCSTTAPRSSAARPPAPAALADAGPLGLPRRARRRPRPETSQPSHGVPRSPRPSRHRGMACGAHTGEPAGYESPARTTGSARPAGSTEPRPFSRVLEHRDSNSYRMECVGFGINLLSGNYEFACLILIDDEEWWRRFGSLIEANWEIERIRLYSSRDTDGLRISCWTRGGATRGCSRSAKACAALPSSTARNGSPRHGSR